MTPGEFPEESSELLVRSPAYMRRALRALEIEEAALAKRIELIQAAANRIRARLARGESPPSEPAPGG